MRRSLPIAIAASVAVVLSTPYVGQARGAVENAFPRQYTAIVAGLIAAAAASAFAFAVARILEHRVARYAALLAALLIAVIYAVVMRSGEASRDLVERFHFVEYGFVAFLFSSAWRSRADASAVALPLLAGVFVGIVDEWVQWYVPSRVGELSDVLLNGVAVASGVLFSAAVQPPGSLRGLRADSARAVGVAAGAVVLAGAFFVHAVHLGYEIVDGDALTFLSTFTRAELTAAAAERGDRWRTSPPVAEPGFAREDHYLSEARWHLQRRNEHWSSRDIWAASRENLILERYYFPVLDLAVPESRWPPDIRAAAAAVTEHRHYVSDASPYPIFTVSHGTFWIAATTILAAIGLSTRTAMRAARAPVAG